MLLIVKIINVLFQLLFFPLRVFPEIWSLTIISVVTGIVMLIIFRYTSNQKVIRETKNKIKAHIFELVFYKDNFKIIAKAIGKIMRYNALYLKQTIIPLLFVFIPVILILIQLNFRYQYRAFRAGEQTLVKVKLHEDKSGEMSKIKFLPSSYYKVETPPLRIFEQPELDWRIRILKQGTFNLLFENEGDTITKKINPSGRLAMLAPKRTGASFWQYLFAPAEEPITEQKSIKSIEIQYPNRALKVWGMKVHWLIVFFIISLVAAFGLKGVFRVEI